MGCHGPIALNHKEFVLVRRLAPISNAGPELALRPQLAPGISVEIHASQLQKLLPVGLGTPAEPIYLPMPAGEA